MNRLAVYSYLIRYVMGMPGVADQRTFARKELLKKSYWGHNTPPQKKKWTGVPISYILYMLQLDPNGTQHKKFQQNWCSTFSGQGRTKGQRDKRTKPTRTPFPGSDLGSEWAESDNKVMNVLITSLLQHFEQIYENQWINRPVNWREDKDGAAQEAWSGLRHTCGHSPVIDL